MRTYIFLTTISFTTILHDQPIDTVRYFYLPHQHLAIVQGMALVLLIYNKQSRRISYFSVISKFSMILPPMWITNVCIIQYWLNAQYIYVQFHNYSLTQCVSQLHQTLIQCQLISVMQMSHLIIEATHVMLLLCYQSFALLKKVDKQQHGLYQNMSNTCKVTALVVLHMQNIKEYDQ